MIGGVSFYPLQRKPTKSCYSKPWTHNKVKSNTIHLYKENCGNNNTPIIHVTEKKKKKRVSMGH